MDVKTTCTVGSYCSCAYRLSPQACPFVIDVYCEDGKPVLQAVNLESGAKMLSTALQRSIVSRGEGRPVKGHDGVSVYTCRGESRISSVIANKVPQLTPSHT